MIGNPRRELSLLLQHAMVRDGLKNKAELSRRMGIPGQRVRSYIRGDCQAETDLEVIAAYLGMSLDELLDRMNTVRSPDVVPYFGHFPEMELVKLKKALDSYLENLGNNDAEAA